MVWVDLAITETGTPDGAERLRLSGEAPVFAGLVEIASGTAFEGTVVDGLSGLVYDPESATYFAVSDDRGSTDDGGAITASPRL